MPQDAEGARLSLKLLETRQKLGYQQADMAYHFKVSRVTYWRWEKLGVPDVNYLRIMIKLMLQKLNRKARYRRYGVTAKRAAAQKAWRTRKRMKEARQPAEG
jgi:DNA-binding XRE family transcriptional regulator